MPLTARIGRPHEVSKRLLTLFISNVGFYRKILKTICDTAVDGRYR